ncbi:hypothetical protein M0R45_018747 [Rubus argutus]|uniref:Calcium-transporting ATPase n=1 Tax=Rubus argutus TaxID=59490 RepID=A0AAW1X598_RUBAR
MGGCTYNTSNDLEAGPKDAPVHRFRRYWQQARVFLKAYHHFRYALVLKRIQEKKEQTTKKVRVRALAVQAAHVLKEGANQVQGAGDHFLIQPDKLAKLTRTDSGVDVLREYGGKEGLAVKLKTNLDNGINEDDNLPQRRIKFGSNEYPRRTGRSLRTCIREALHNFTRIVLVIVFVGSVVMGILEETGKLGWRDIFSVAIAAAIFILFTGSAAISDYTQDRQLQHMIKEFKRNNIQMIQSKEVIRVGQPVLVSIGEIVVGDVIPLKSGDEVPADGIFIGAQSLSIDKSRITGESTIFHKDSTRPFLRSGWRVADGSGTMLVTAVGKFTESGNIMASTNSKDADKKAPLQVLLKEVSTFMGAVGFLVAVVVASVVWSRGYLTGDNLNGSHPIPGDALEEVIKISLIAVPIFVVAVTEVLLLSYDLILLSSMKKINADKALVRRPAAYATMAFCNNLICDKIAIVEDEGGCKSGIKEAMKLYQSAGIKVLMVTHDNLQTAKAIAMECGILGSEASDVSGENLVEGKVFRELPDSDRERKADNILVMAESSPQDKLLLVQALRKRGKVVAVTGYVTDDAHALHEADIGLAMGSQGTEFVKENSDIIILDDNLATVAKVFIWGRSVHEKVLKVMQQQLTANGVAVAINCMAAVYYRHIPLNAVQFVWVNLIIFGLGPLTLATEPPADHLMSRPPIDQGQPCIKYMPWMRLLMKVGYQIIALLVINFQAKSLLKNYTSDHATKVKNTMIFNTFVSCQISIQFGARKTGILDSPLYWVTSNSVFLGIMGIILAIQFIIIEFLGKTFFIVRLNWNEWQFSLTLGLGEVFFAMLLFAKYLSQRNNH